MTTTINNFSLYAKSHHKSQVGDLRSSIRGCGFKGVWIVLLNKKQCIWVLWAYMNGIDHDNLLGEEDFENKYDLKVHEAHLEHQRELNMQNEHFEEAIIIEKEPKMATSQTQDLATSIAELLTKQETPVMDMAKVREIVAEEVGRLTPRKLEIKSHGITTGIVDAQHKHFKKLLTILETEGNAFLVGEAGSGKTSAIFNMAKALDIGFALIPCNEMTDKIDFAGYMDANGKFVAGPAYEVYKNGGILGIDELEKGGGNAMTALNALLANNMYQFPNGEVVTKHDKFHAIACGNTYGRGASRQYVGANQLDASTLDRFDVLEWDIDEKLEMDIATDKEWCSIVQGLREAVRSFDGTIQLIVSMRATLRGERLLASGFKHKEIFEMLVYKGLDKGSKKKIADKAADIMTSRVS